MVVLVWSNAGREERAVAMPVRRDPRTDGWYFRTIVKRPDGTRTRVFGTPGVPGPYQDLAASKVGAQEAERRAIRPVSLVASATVLEMVPNFRTLVCSSSRRRIQTCRSPGSSLPS